MIYKNENNTVLPNVWTLNDTIKCSLKKQKFYDYVESNYPASLANRLKNQITEIELNTFDSFLSNGFTPLITCFSEKSHTNKPIVLDTVNWFTFDGIRKGTLSSTSTLLSRVHLAVNYNKKEQTFTVYEHSDWNSEDLAQNSKRIAIFDNINSVFNLTENCLPIKGFFIDWDKIKLDVALSPVNDNDYDFERQLKFIIGKILEFCDKDKIYKNIIQDNVGIYGEHIIVIPFEYKDKKFELRFTHVLQGDYIKIQLIFKSPILYNSNESKIVQVPKSRTVIATIDVERKDELKLGDNPKDYPITFEEINNDILPQFGLQLQVESK